MKWIILHLILNCDYNTNICKGATERKIVKANVIDILDDISIRYESEKQVYRHCRITVNNIVRVANSSCTEVIKTVNKGL